MGISRLPRPSEESLSLVFNEIRNLDKLLWKKDKYLIQRVREDVRIVKQRLDCVVEQFIKECNVA